MSNNLKANCPVCDAEISLADDIEESEIINCRDCNSRLVVNTRNGAQVVLGKAPDIEEDWGQ